MSLPKFSLNRPVTVSMVFGGILLLGIISLINLPIELMPNINLGRITITTYVRGGMPSCDVEERISKPLEDALSDLSHLKDILTISKEGESTVVLEFLPEANMNYASLEVREKLTKIKNKMPKEAERPIIAQYTYGEFPVIAVTFISEKFSPESLRKMVESAIKEKFLRVEGAARIEVVGGREEKILIELDENKLSAYNLPLDWILDTLGKNNINLIGGNIQLGNKKYLIRCLGEFSNIGEIKNLGVAVSSEGSIIRLKDIGEVKRGYLEPRELARLNIEPAVTLYIFKKSLSNTLKVCKGVKEVAGKIAKDLGKDIKTVISFNQAEFISKAIGQLKSSLIVGSILAVSVLFLFLRSFSAIFVLSLSIPFSVFFVFIFMYLFKISLNAMTLAGLSLGVGMLLDSSIIVLENIFKEKKEIIEKDEIIHSTEEVSLPIFASVITTIIVFLPFIFINKETQRLYSGIALSITFSLIGSVFISLALVPSLSRLFLKKRATVKTLFFERFERMYRRSLEFILDFRHILTLLAIAGSCTSIFLFQKLDKEFVGIPEQDKFTIFIELPTGTKLDVTDKIVKKVEKVVERYRKDGEVKHYTTRIEPYSARIYVELEPLGKRKLNTTQIISALRKETDKLKPAFIYYEEPQATATKEIILEFFGYDYGILKKLAMESAKLISGIQELTDVKIRIREGAPEIKILLDRQRLALVNLDTFSVATKLHGKLRGLIPTRFRPTEEAYLSLRKKEEKEELPLSLYPRYAKEIEMIARLQKKYREKIENIERTTLINPQGKKIQLRQIADFKIDIAPSEIWRKNKKRMVQVSANRGNLALGRAAQKIEEALKDIKLPENYLWKFGGDYQKMLRNQKELRFSFILAIILVYLVLASMFESLSQPFIILSSIPLAFIGSVTALYIKKGPVGIGVLIGLIMLVGIVVNNAIILIHRMNELKKKLSLRERVLLASTSRLRPILMTTLTTILSLFPLLIFKTEASNLWAPLALTVIWGLSVSCLLTLYIIPSLYLLFQRR